MESVVNYKAIVFDTIVVESESATETMTFCVQCEICGEDLGNLRAYFAQEHMKKCPEHRKYSILVRKS